MQETFSDPTGQSQKAFFNARAEAVVTLPYQTLKSGLKGTVNTIYELAQAIQRGEELKASGDLIVTSGMQSMMGHDVQAEDTLAGARGLHQDGLRAIQSVWDLSPTEQAESVAFGLALPTMVGGIFRGVSGLGAYEARGPALYNDLDSWWGGRRVR